ncbi:MAG: membrane protein insertion efficiency factor YidD [Thermodesulfobacteriota bacterium]|nr:membrane protein insertion efficiency factor YidD [Thermodesulfobacteriota bacterium]
MKQVLTIFIRVYQCCISPFTISSCRFYPSCSQYALEAVEIHGTKGILFAIKRVLKCHPFHPGGFDPVPKI